MPTMEQLGQLATYLYNYDVTIGAQQDISSGINWEPDKIALFTAQSPGATNYFYVWSGQERSQEAAYSRNFAPTTTYLTRNDRYISTLLAVCLDQ